MKKISTCPICSRRCTMEIEVENGQMLSLRGKNDDGFEGCSALCPKGIRAIEYRNRPDRILSPLRRVGARGEGKFEEISWDEAIEEISGKLLALREKQGASSVAFFAGYTKWFRPLLQRFASFFGSVNYGTESSSCQRSAIMANICDTGLQAPPDYAKAGVILATARRRFQPPLKAAVRGGAKLIVVDCGESPEIKALATLHLRPRPGTDIALAYAIARELIVSNKVDEDYISRHVHGYDDYAKRAMEFSPEKAEAITGVSAKDIVTAAEIIGENLPMCIFEGFTGLIHHRNGMQAVRAWEALGAITGCYGRPGGNIPAAKLRCDGYPESTFQSFELSHPFEMDRTERIGASRFPLWTALLDECQAMDFPAAAENGELKAIFALGMNARMFPDSEGIFEMLKKLDFFVNCDVFLSDTCRYADIVLPAAVSFERHQLATVKFDSMVYFQKPIVEPLGLARSDHEILSMLSRKMGLGDGILEGSEEKAWEFLLSGTGISLAELKELGRPVAIPPVKKPLPLEEGFPTPSGKFELSSLLIAPFEGLDPLPDYVEPLGDQDREAYPLCLMAGVRTERYGHALHCRTHTVPEIRALRAEAAVDVHSADAEALGIRKGDRVSLETPWGAIEVGVDIDDGLLRGCVNMYHGYSEADVNTLIPADYLDPYSGFPGYKAIACRIRKI